MVRTHELLTFWWLCKLNQYLWLYYIFVWKKTKVRWMF